MCREAAALVARREEAVVATSLEAGVTASEVARSAGIHVNQLFRWRKDLCGGSDAGTSQLVPVAIVPAEGSAAGDGNVAATRAPASEEWHHQDRTRRWPSCSGRRRRRCRRTATWPVREAIEAKAERGRTGQFW
ncbi:transposase [Mesorhizobium sp. B2-3-3]|nr:transposase [Mesorhizobium sp. B2-3-3]